MPHAPLAQPKELPISRAELGALGWDELDVLLVSGDGLLDHPASGVALLARWLIEHGYRTGVVAQPRWDTVDDIVTLGRPRLFAGVTAGSVDSMVANYTSFRAPRRDDGFTPGGRAGRRPNRATIVYCGLLRQAFKGLVVVLGGIEASLRRASHYDFWTDSIRRSVLFDAKADLLVYGMAERTVLTIAERLQRHATRAAKAPVAAEVLQGIPGTAYAGPPIIGDSLPGPVQTLPSHEAMARDPAQLLALSLALEQHVHHGAAWATQAVGDRLLVIAPPAAALSTAELDRLYSLPFTREAHSSYREPISALEMLRFSITSHRGCAGGCSFCSLALHQGRTIHSRSAESLLAEARAHAAHPRFRGQITDVGGPSANMWGARCARTTPTCARASCLHPKRCRHFVHAQEALTDLLHQLAALDGVRSVRIASGVRHDLALDAPRYVEALVSEFTGGQLKLAPEHINAALLSGMRKPSAALFRRFLDEFTRISEHSHKRQFVVPYLMSAFPGCTDADMRELARFLAERGWRPQQVQCFLPTPSTVATAMYAAATDERGHPIFVARTDRERQAQHRLLATNAAPSNRLRRKPKSK